MPRSDETHSILPSVLAAPRTPEPVKASFYFFRTGNLAPTQDDGGLRLGRRPPGIGDSCLGMSVEIEHMDRPLLDDLSLQQFPDNHRLDELRGTSLPSLDGMLQTVDGQGVGDERGIRQ